MTVRIGLLSSAAINRNAILEPAAGNQDVEIAAVAARDRTRAAEYATEHGIARVDTDYEALISDDQIDAIYIGLPISLHGAWTIKALQAGKHVLCEKALTANAAEAEQVRDVTAETGLVMMHAFHNRYHRLLARIGQIIDAGELGALQRIEANFEVPQMPAGDIRWNYDLGGGVTPDIGIYPIDLVRVLDGRRPTVTSVEYQTGPDDPRVDAVLSAELDFGAGLTGRIHGAMGQGGDEVQTAVLTGELGTLTIDHFVHPQRGNRLTLRVDNRDRIERVAAQPTSYAAQLSAFVAAITDGVDFPTDAADAIETMRIIDDCYTVAGLPLREPYPG